MAPRLGWIVHFRAHQDKARFYIIWDVVILPQRTVGPLIYGRFAKGAMRLARATGMSIVPARWPMGISLVLTVAFFGEVAEWLKAHAWKACRRGTVSRVRIPLSPPLLNSAQWAGSKSDVEGTVNEALFDRKLSECHASLATAAQGASPSKSLSTQSFTKAVC